ncbi:MULTISPECIES: hypothetical protein [Bacillus]|uniref:hypothetical protein n=1 Tax=Bacillus TaxID=1386 RepID=UPI000429A75C|nr:MULTISPECIES: hypothetical protein [Bacillus]QHZ48626.1 hypothetical protein M654_021420 [Bacillus sp. NSP9.1]WFA05735.1 hypothetical protein P3X63_02475 [Bacillus sp. HSf4]
MLKLKENTKYGKLPSDIQTHLTASSSKDDKLTMLGFVILFLDIICGGPLIANGEKMFMMIALPFMLGINIWTVIVMFLKPSYRNNLHFTLYKGGTGAVLSFCYFVLSQKYAFSALGFNLLFFMISLLACIMIILGFIRYYLIVFPNFQKKRTGSPAWGTYLLTIGPGLGYIIAQFIFRFSDSIVTLFMSYIYLFLACFFIYFGVKFFHQYFFIRANQDIIDKHLRKGKYSHGRK